jgi:hypothetical protein
LAAEFGVTVYYFGNEPVGFLDALRAAIDAGGNFGIDGLLGALGIQVTPVVDTETDTDDGTGTGTDDGTGTGTDDGTGTGTDDGTGTGTDDGTGTGTDDGTEANTDDGTETNTDDGRGADGNGDNVAGAARSIGGDDSKPVGIAVGVVAAGLAVVLFAVILVAGRRRRRSEKVEDGAVIHQQFTDDESYIREIDEEAGAIAQVVSEDDDSVVIRWGEEKSGDQPIYSQPIESILSSDDMQYVESHACSSPSCRICAMKAEEGVGVHFISPRSSNAPVSLSRESRSYESNDTVDL